jgi:hypothetical protein
MIFKNKFEVSNVFCMIYCLLMLMFLIIFNCGYINSGSTTCAKETTPMKGSTSSVGLPPQSYVLQNVLQKVTKPVHLLNITALSELRKDGHPSVHNIFHHMDCVHWCVGGVPDTWNELLYASIMN